MDDALLDAMAQVGGVQAQPTRPMQVREPLGFWDDLGRRAVIGLPASISTMLTSSPAAEGAEVLVPSVLQGTYGLLGQGFEWLFGTELPGARRAARLYDAHQQHLYDIIGLQGPPTNPVAAFVEGLSGAMVPGGAILYPARASAAVRSLGGLTSAASPAIRWPARLLGGAADLGLRFNLPLNQGRNLGEYATEALASGVISTGATELIAQGLDMPESWEEAVAEGWIPEGSDVPLFYEPWSVFTGQREAQQPVYPDARAAGAEGAAASIARILANREDTEELEAHQDNNWLHDIAVGAAGALGAAAAYRWYRSRAAQVRAQREMDAAGFDVGPPEADRVVTPGEGVVSGLQDQFHGLLSVAERNIGAPIGPRQRGLPPLRVTEEDYDQLNRMVRTTGSDAVLGPRVAAALDRGEFPESYRDAQGNVIRLPESLTRMMREADGLSPEVNGRIWRYMSFGDALDQRNNASWLAQQANARAGTNRPTDIRPTYAELDTPTLRNQYNQLATDPVVVHWATRIRAMLDAARDYMHAAGLMNTKLYNEVRHNQPRYFPNYEYEKAASGARRWFRLLDQAPNHEVGWTAKELIPRKFENTQPWTTHQKPWQQSLVEHMESVVRYSERNRMRAQAMYVLREKPVKDPADGNVVVYERSGPRYYNIKDPNILKAVQLDPVFFIPFMNNIRRVAMDLTARRGNPLFPFTTAYWNTMMMIQNAPRGYRVGWEKRLGDTRANVPGRPPSWEPDYASDRIPDYTAFANVSWRILANLRDTMYKGARDFLDESLGKNGRLVQIFGRQAVQAAADAAARAWTGSWLSLAQRNGVTAARMQLYADAQGAVTRLVDYAPRTAGASPRWDKWWRFYGAVLDSVRDAPTVELYRLNARHVPFDKLVPEVRQFGGDIGTIGGHKGIQALKSSVMFLNVAVQAAAATVRMVRTHPMRMLTFTTGLGFVAWQIMDRTNALGPEYQDHYWNALTPEQRTGNIIVYHEGQSPDQYTPVPLPYEFRPFYALMHEIINALNGYQAGTYTDKGWQTYVADMLDTDTWMEAAGAAATQVGNMAGDLAPPLAHAVAAMFDVRLRADINDPGIRPIRDDYIPEGNRVIDTLHSEHFEGIIEAFMGAAGDTLLETVRAFERGMTGSLGDWERGLEAAMDRLPRELSEGFRPGANTLWAATMDRSAFTQSVRDAYDMQRGADAIISAVQSVRTGMDQVNNLQQFMEYEYTSPTPQYHPAVMDIIRLTWPYLQRVDTMFGRELYRARNQLDRIQIANLELFGEDLSVARNELVDQIEKLSRSYLEEMQSIEQQVHQQLGYHSFTFADFDPKYWTPE